MNTVFMQTSSQTAYNGTPSNWQFCGHEARLEATMGPEAECADIDTHSAESEPKDLGPLLKVTEASTRWLTNAFYIQSPRLQSNLPSTDGISFCRSS